jgi:hypothetical protein
MHVRNARYALGCALLLHAVLGGVARAAGAETKLDAIFELQSRASRLIRLFPHVEVAVETEGGDYETTLTVTILDHLPEWLRRNAALRRLHLR